jgi:hypothetical protein
MYAEKSAIVMAQQSQIEAKNRNKSVAKRFMRLARTVPVE